MEYQVGEDCAGAVVEARQLVDWNCVSESGFMDDSSLAEGLRLPNPRRGHGDTEREVCGR